jgi:predicted TIM-barrel fold metal-dependent hydrolase
MDKAGVDKSVVFGVDWAYGVTGEAKITLKEQNRFYSELAKKYKDRLIALYTLDPRRPDMLDLATEAIEKWGMRGFKLMPNTGWFPNDPICFPLYEKCAKWGVPIVFHSGGYELQWECGQPMYIASAAERFHDVKMVMAHAGGESWSQALAAATQIPNVYLDIALRQFDYKINPQAFYSWLRNLVDWVGPHKISFASDGPLTTLLMSDIEWVNIIKKVDILTPEEKEFILGKTALSIFNFS